MPRERKILVTGVAGTGKTKLAQELKKRGFACIDDATNDKNLGTWYDLKGNRLPYDTHHSKNFSWEKVRWGWDIEKLEKFLRQHKFAVVCGYMSKIENIAKKYFDEVILLDITPEIINIRLNKRKNSYGYKLDERQQVLKDSVRLRQRLALLPNLRIIDASWPTEQIVDSILSKEDLK